MNFFFSFLSTLRADLNVARLRRPREVMAAAVAGGCDVLYSGEASDEAGGAGIALGSDAPETE